MLLALVAAACGDGGERAAGGSGRARVVATTNILGDVVANLVGDEAEVVVILPPNTDPHDFALSPQQARSMREADLLVVNGLGFEESLLDALDAAQAEGVALYEATSAIEAIPPDEDGGDGGDPHFFTDPVRMAQVTADLSRTLVEEVGLQSGAVERNTDRYLAALGLLDEDIRSRLAEIPPQQRKLVTNHDVFAYFAARYDLRVVGTVIPASTTLAEPGAAGLSELAETLRGEGVRAIFTDASAGDRLAEALAGELGGPVEVVPLFTESLGPEGSGGATYLEMMRTNAERIADALGG